MLRRGTIFLIILLGFQQCCLFLYLYSSYIKITFNFQEVPLYIQTHYSKHGNVLVGMATMLSDEIRRIISYQTWITDFLNNPRHSILYVMENSSQSHFKYMAMDPIEFNFSFDRARRDQNIVLKRITAMKYFLENTTYEWFLTSCDDLHIDAERFDRMMYEIEQHNDPLNDIVIKGHLRVGKKSNICFLQGGSGFLFSRKAAQIFYDGYPALKWLDETDAPDDVHARKILEWFNEHYNFTLQNYTCPYMLGNVDKKNILKTSILKRKFPQCSARKCHDRCNDTLYNEFEPLNKLAIIHSKYPLLDKLTAFKHLKELSLRNNTYFITGCPEERTFCTGKPYDNSSHLHFYC